MITSEWPTIEDPGLAPFIVGQVESLRRAGVEVEVFQFRGAKKPQNYLRSWWQVRHRMNMSQFDLIHAQFGQSGLLGIPEHVPLIVTFHGSDLLGIVGSDGHYTMAGTILRLISRFVAILADQVIVVSESMVRHLPKRSCHIIPCGVNLDLFRPMSQSEAREKLGLPMGKRLVIFPNPEKAEKRHDLAQQAISRLGHEIDAELVSVSRVPHELMPYYMNACDALLLTSLHEGSPTIVKEALACNLPVVSVDVGDVRARIASVEGCVVCSDDHPDTIAINLQRVLSQRMRIDGRSAVQALDERLLIKKVIDVYEQAVRR